MGVRPGVVGPSPNSISQGMAGVLSFGVDGGFFGTGSSPAVSATYNGQLRGIQLPASQTIGSTRQLSITIGGATNANDFTVPGLYPVAIKSATDSTKFAVTNLAVQPTYAAPTATRIAVGSVPASSAPNDVAINPATGVAVVANTGSNDISLIDLTTATPSFITNICTAAVGAVPPCPSSGPTGVSVDYVRNIALVVNAAAKTVAVVDLNAKAVTFVLPVLQDTPEAVGINPVTGRALVAMQTTNYGALMDLTQNPPIYAGIVSISTGPSTRVAVEPHLQLGTGYAWRAWHSGDCGFERAIEQRNYRHLPDDKRGYGHRASHRDDLASVRGGRRRRPNSEHTISLRHALSGRGARSHI